MERDRPTDRQKQRQRQTETDREVDGRWQAELQTDTSCINISKIGVS